VQHSVTIVRCEHKSDEISAGCELNNDEISAL
jgi:hypothetical protein